MFVIGLLGWWYGAGWRQRLVIVRERIASTVDYFSIDLLLGTLFAPFRQISAGDVRGPLTVQMRALFDNLLSRVIGSTVRLMMVFVGSVAIVVTLIVGLLSVIGWALVPAIPLIGLLLASVGWLPWIR